ncbi:MAG: glyceraldehyde 3-phosphate dehydrogenase NAD-binding domain-containing protein, partial [Candidatus Saccharibacteria bacterium]|nr:glyceraldehyde 3-phosphate dehydrogenase NAD-binding domain-containing protein [Candidatus Saccharibacteria bacterium]
MIKVAINGFGRIGRNALKILLDRRDVQVVAINDITDAKTLAHLLKHDSSYGTYDKRVSATENSLLINTREIPVYAERDPAKLPWKKLGVDVVI